MLRGGCEAERAGACTSCATLRSEAELSGSCGFRFGFGLRLRTGGGLKVAGRRQLLEEDAQRKKLRDGRTRLGLRMPCNV